MTEEQCERFYIYREFYDDHPGQIEEVEAFSMSHPDWWRIFAVNGSGSYGRRTTGDLDGTGKPLSPTSYCERVFRTREAAKDFAILLAKHRMSVFADRIMWIERWFAEGRL